MPPSYSRFETKATCSTRRMNAKHLNPTPCREHGRGSHWKGLNGRAFLSSLMTRRIDPQREQAIIRDYLRWRWKVPREHLLKKYKIGHQTLYNILDRYGIPHKKFKPANPCPTEVKVLAYFAGIVDGEGTLGISQRGKGKYLGRPFFGVVNTNEELIKWIAKHFKGTVTCSKRGQGRKPLYKWYATRLSDIKQILEAILPYLIVKKEKAEEVIAECEKRLSPI